MTRRLVIGDLHSGELIEEGAFNEESAGLAEELEGLGRVDQLQAGPFGGEPDAGDEIAVVVDRVYVELEAAGVEGEAHGGFGLALEAGDDFAFAHADAIVEDLLDLASDVFAGEEVGCGLGGGLGGVAG